MDIFNEGSNSLINVDLEKIVKDLGIEWKNVLDFDKLFVQQLSKCAYEKDVIDFIKLIDDQITKSEFVKKCFIMYTLKIASQVSTLIYATI